MKIIVEVADPWHLKSQPKEGNQLVKEYWLEGDYEYLDSDCFVTDKTQNNLPSFDISVSNFGQIFFYCEKEEELDELISHLQKIKEAHQKNKALNFKNFN